MADDRFERLTQRQRACLRLVAEALTTKEIADRLGYSDHVVDKLVKEACAIIGTNRRGPAARQFIEYEQHQGVQKLDVQSPDLGAIPQNRDCEASPDDRVMVTSVREERAQFEIDLERSVPFKPNVPGENDHPASEPSARDQAKAGLELSVKITAILAMLCLVAVLLSKALGSIEAIFHLPPK